MPAPTDFLEALVEGVRKVVVPTRSVIEPLEPSRKRAAITVPSAGAPAARSRPHPKAGGAPLRGPRGPGSPSARSGASGPSWAA